jgi:hypothetical protein
MRATVRLGTLRVGQLEFDRGSGRARFSFDRSYLETVDRPVLGRWFEDQVPRHDVPILPHGDDATLRRSS